MKWNNFQSSIITAFESLQNTEDLADVTLTCEGISVKAHKIILSACSPYFRTVFKENPCPHPIVILKDVFYIDLLAVLNFMYHGEVLVSKDQLKSFLQTAEVLQVSGLNGYNDFNAKNVPTSKNVPPKVQKAPRVLEESAAKRMKMSPKNKPAKTAALAEINNAKKDSPKATSPPDDFESVQLGKIKTEVAEEDYTSDYNKNTEIQENEKSKQQSSILEAALDGKEQGPSILERSLTSSSTAGTHKIFESPITIVASGNEVVNITSNCFTHRCAIACRCSALANLPSRSGVEANSVITETKFCVKKLRNFTHFRRKRAVFERNANTMLYEKLK